MATEPEFDHVAFMQDEDEWPHWPYLPVKNYPKVGLLVGGQGPTVYLKNMYDQESLQDVEKIEYADFEACFDAGWRVD